MKRPEEYGLKRELQLCNPRDQEVYERILRDLDLDERSRGKPRRPIWDDIGESKGINTDRGVAGYETQIGLDLFDYLLTKAKEANGFRVLDAGCGKGRCTEELRLFAMLKNIPATMYARDLIPPEGLSGVVVQSENIMSMVDEGFFDLILSSFVLPHLTNPLRAIENLYAALRPDGMLATTIFPEAITINRHRLDSQGSGFLEKIALAGGSGSFKTLPDNPDLASAVHLIRGVSQLEKHAFHTMVQKPLRGWPVQVDYSF